MAMFLKRLEWPLAACDRMQCNRNSSRLASMRVIDCTLLHCVQPLPCVQGVLHVQVCDGC